MILHMRRMEILTHENNMFNRKKKYTYTKHIKMHIASLELIVGSFDIFSANVNYECHSTLLLDRVHLVKQKQPCCN